MLKYGVGERREEAGVGGGGGGNQQINWKHSHLYSAIGEPSNASQKHDESRPGGETMYHILKKNNNNKT